MIRITWLAVALVATVAFARQEQTPPKNAPPQDAAASEMRWTFEDGEAGKLPQDFSTALTGSGDRGVWVIAEDKTASSGGKVLAQTSADDTELRFPLCLYDKTTFA